MLDPPALLGELRVRPQRGEGSGRAAAPVPGRHDGERAQVVHPVRRPVLETHLSWRVEEDVDDGPFRRGQQDVLDERLPLVPAAVPADLLHPGAAHGEVEQPGVGRVDQVQAHHLAERRCTRVGRLAVDQQHVAESAHRGEVRPGPAERGDVPVLDEQVVEGDRQVSVDGRPVGRVGRLDDDRAVQAHLLREVLAHVRVVPVEAGVGELHLAAVAAADRDGFLGLVRDAVVAVLQPETVPVHGRLHVAVVAYVHGDPGSLRDVERRAGDRAVVGEHPQVAVQLLADRADREAVAVTVGQPDQLRTGDLGQPGGLRRRTDRGRSSCRPSVEGPRRAAGSDRPARARECRVPGPDRTSPGQVGPTRPTSPAERVRRSPRNGPEATRGFIPPAWPGPVRLRSAPPTAAEWVGRAASRGRCRPGRAGRAGRRRSSARRRRPPAAPSGPCRG